MLKYHLIGFFAGFLLDQWFGDPHGIPHPVCWIGALIRTLEKWLYPKVRDESKEWKRGRELVVCVLAIVSVISTGIYIGSYMLHPYVGIAVEAVMTAYILAAKSLKDESMKVYDRLRYGTLEEARNAVSMIVGRDTANLTEIGVAKAAVETVAENASDGVIAPLLYTAAGGPVLGFFYKAVNTMDSMIAYKNETYLYFGRTAAKLDDFMNYLPSRISAWLMIGAAYLSGREYSGKEALRIYRRDRKKHASPNAAQTESACAGALQIQLAGDACYFGKIVKKPYLGDPVRPVEYEDIRRANYLMYKMTYFCEIICLLVLWLLGGGMV